MQLFYTSSYFDKIKKQQQQQQQQTNNDNNLVGRLFQTGEHIKQWMLNTKTRLLVYCI